MAILTDEELSVLSQEKLQEAEVIPDEKLQKRQMANLKLARAIAKELYFSEKLNGVYAAMIPPASDRVRTAGLYGTSTKVIYISLDQLLHARAMLDTLIHELAHHKDFTESGHADDLTVGHAAAMTYVAAAVVQNVHEGKFQDLLEYVTW